MPEKSITILGVEFTPQRFPNLYQIAERNPEGLAEQLQGWAKMAVNSDMASVAATFEHDLEHERRSGGEQGSKR